MVKLNKDLSGLRDNAISRTRAATNKISRNRRNGIEIAGSFYDPRKPLDYIKRYTTIQLNFYLDRVNAFMSRSSQFIPSVLGKAIHIGDWEDYKALEGLYNKIGAEHYEDINPIFIPDSGMTIGDRNSFMLPKLRPEGNAVNRPYNAITRDVENINGIESLATLTKDMMRKVSRNYLKKEVAASRDVMQQMFELLGEYQFADQAMELTDNQFNIFWHESGGAGKISTWYAMFKMMSTNMNDSHPIHNALDVNREIVSDRLEWAKTLPLKPPNKSHINTYKTKDRRIPGRRL